MKASAILLVASLLPLYAIPLEVINPSIEVNDGTSGTSASDPSVLGWDGSGTLEEGAIDYGNGRWKLTFSENQEVRQLTSHAIEAGASYSLRFDATLISSSNSEPANVIVGGSRLNGDFNSDSSTTDERSFADTPFWFNLAGNQAQQATRLAPASLAQDGTRNGVLPDTGNGLFALDTEHDLATDEQFQLSYDWIDAAGWNDASDQIQATLYITDDDTITGTRTNLAAMLSGASTSDATSESFAGTFAPIPATADGKRLFLLIEAVDGNASTGGFARIDNVRLALFTPLLIGPGIRNGDFNDDPSTADSRTFDDTPFWVNLNGAQTVEATRTNIVFDGTRNTVNGQTAASQIFANDPDYTGITGDTFTVSFVWRDASGWSDGADRFEVSLFTTDDDTLTGAQTLIQALTTGLSTANNSWDSFSGDFDPLPASANAKRIFVQFKALDGDSSGGGFGRVDNFQLSVNDPNPTIPGGGGTGGTGSESSLIAEAFIDNGGTPQVIASRTFILKSQRNNTWDHYHFAIPSNTMDAFAGQNLAIRFRGPGGEEGISCAIDNVRLDYYPSSSPGNSFSYDWNTPNRTWVGPGFWGNRMQDWQLSNNRIETINGAKDRRTAHHVGTTIRGNGEDFSFSVRTGLNAGTNNSAARTGFLLGAGPNLDWRGALLVHDGLGRDFGLFLGLDGSGRAVIEDYSTGSVTTIANGATPTSFTNNTNLALEATYNAVPGTYTLTLEARSAGGTLLSSASIEVPSDRVLGSHGLLSHRGSNNAQFWFDDFSGTGGALQAEEERHLAIIGAMHTLSRQTLKLTAQLSPVSIADTSPLSLETWDGNQWNQVATAAIDNTDNLSSFTATFKVTNWDDTRDTLYRVGISVDGSHYYWNGTIRRDPIDKENLVIASTTCQRIADIGLEAEGVDWSPVDIWQPHTLAFSHIAKHQPDVLLATGDQIYEGQPTPPDRNSGDFNRQHDYLYKWSLWVLQVRELTRDIPTVAIPDDHDVFQGNLWGEGGILSNNQNNGGYVEPASWVKMVERTQTSNLPDADPYNPTQPAPPANAGTGIGVYFTGMTYGRLGFAILEDRKFKTGRDNFPADPAQQFMFGERQKDFLRAFASDWEGQDLKLAVSQTPLGQLRTHGSTGYGFGVNDRDSNGWPAHRRSEVWELFRLSRMFQLAGDQHLATVAQHGTDAPATAGYSFTSPAIANFFPRCWDPVHNAGGRTNIISPYKGDFFLDGKGTLPSGEPNLTSEFPNHLRVFAIANPLEYHNLTRNINPANLHDRGAGYGIIHVNKATRQITFECWPLHADPEFPQTGLQFPDWPVSIAQTDNDGRVATGFLPLIETRCEQNPVISVYNESTSELLYTQRILGNKFRPPVYENSSNYRVEISYRDDPVSETLPNQTATTAGPAALHSFTSLSPSITVGNSSLLQWDVESDTTLTIDNGLGDVTTYTVNGIGHLPVSPGTTTTYTLTLDDTITAQTTIQVFPAKDAWLAANFTAAERADPLISGDEADPDNDGYTNEEEFRFQTNPRNAASTPKFGAGILHLDGTLTIDFDAPFPVDSPACLPSIEASPDLLTWTTLPETDYREVARQASLDGTSRLTVRLLDDANAQSHRFYRASWTLP